MKPLLKLGFIDYFSPIDKFFTNTLSEEFTIERDDLNPDYLFFCDENFGQKNKEFNGKNIIKIFYSGENRRFWNYDCHHAITFDHLDGPVHYRLPLYVVDDWVYRTELGLPSLIDKKFVNTEKTGFCSFVTMNPHCKERNNIFDKLSAYKKVDSAGLHKNNTGYILPREPAKFHTSKFEFISKYKFNICYENSMWPGYVTEKLYHALYCDTIPIYWGSPTVEIDFNIDAIILRHKYEDDESMIEYIKTLDNNEYLYQQKLSKQKLNLREGYFHNSPFNLGRFNRWFKHHVYRGVLNK